MVRNLLLKGGSIPSKIFHCTTPATTTIYSASQLPGHPQRTACCQNVGELLGALWSQARAVLGVQLAPCRPVALTGICSGVHVQHAHSNSSEHREILLGPHAPETDGLFNGREASIILREQSCSHLAPLHDVSCLLMPSATTAAAPAPMSPGPADPFYTPNSLSAE
eukprot:scaffold198005_cov15-Tisochrysis_lutea.AAC.1